MCRVLVIVLISVGSLAVIVVIALLIHQCYKHASFKDVLTRQEDVVSDYDEEEVPIFAGRINVPSGQV